MQTENNASNNSEGTTKKKHPSPLLLIVVLFAAFITIVFITQNKDNINWTEDYQAGVKLAIETNRPIMMTMYKNRLGDFTRRMFEQTFTNPEVNTFLNNNFVPILINVVKQPDIAKKYKYNYEPTHLVILPESEEVIKSRVGHDPPGLFISELKDALQKIEEKQ